MMIITVVTYTVQEMLGVCGKGLVSPGWLVLVSKQLFNWWTSIVITVLKTDQSSMLAQAIASMVSCLFRRFYISQTSFLQL